MAVSLPTSADVRKVRSEASKAVNTQFDLVRTPLLAWVGVGDLAVTKAGEAVDKARDRAKERRAKVRTRAEELRDQVKDLPDELRTNFTGDKLRERYDDAADQVRKTYNELADRGEVRVEKIRTQPQVKKVLDNVSEANATFEERFDKAVDDLHDASEEMLGRVSSETRSAGEKVARTTQRIATETADSVTTAGRDLAEAVTEAGQEAASATRNASRKAANRTAPKKPAPKPTNGSKV